MYKNISEHYKTNVQRPHPMMKGQWPIEDFFETCTKFWEQFRERLEKLEC